MEDLVGGRCGWAGSDPLYVAYHDEEWGGPLHGDDALFELLSLEGVQAGLAWITILRKREAFRAAFSGFDSPRSPSSARRRRAPARRCGDRPAPWQDRGGDRERARGPRGAGGSRRPRLVLRAAAAAPAAHARARFPAKTPESEALSKELRRRGFRFVGPTIVYAFMQSAGLVDDHLVACRRAP